jgi:MOSC domain-containing protein YiiM
MSQGRVTGIAIAPKKRAAMELRDAVSITVAHGPEGDARGSKPGRQVTIVFEDAWAAACRDAGADLPWTTRRANLLVAGLETPATIGAQIRIGDVVLQVCEETAPCMIMERAHAGLRRALKPDWRGGVCCKVISGGEIEIGAAVTLAT